MKNCGSGSPALASAGREGGSPARVLPVERGRPRRPVASEVVTRRNQNPSGFGGGNGVDVDIASEDDYWRKYKTTETFEWAWSQYPKRFVEKLILLAVADHQDFEAICLLVYGRATERERGYLSKNLRSLRDQGFVHPDYLVPMYKGGA